MGIFGRPLFPAGMPVPDVNLAVGSGSYARQTADVMTRFEPVVLETKSDIVLVYGDVNAAEKFSPVRQLAAKQAILSRRELFYGT